MLRELIYLPVPPSWWGKDGDMNELFCMKMVETQVKDYLKRANKRVVQIAERRSSRIGLEKTLSKKERVYSLISKLPEEKRGDYLQWANGVFAMLEMVDPSTLPTRTW